MKPFLVLLAVIPSLGKIFNGQTKLYNFTTGRESFLITGSIGAPLTNIFCWTEKQATLGRFWESGLIEIDARSGEDLKVHLDTSAEIVQEEASREAVFWFYRSTSLIHQREIQISPFKKTCIGVTTSETYHVTGHLLRVDKSLVTLSLIGLAVFSSSHYLAQLGPVAGLSSLLLNILLSCCLWPRWTQRKLRLSQASRGVFWTTVLHTGALLTGSFLLYILYQSKGKLTLSSLGYATFCVSISLLTSERRSTEAIAWFLKMMSLVIIWSSSHNKVGSSLVAACLFVLSSPFSTRSEETVTEVSLTTAQALEQLRSHCQSSDVNVWRLVCQLQKPQTFAHFMTTGQHVSQEDRDKYEEVSQTGNFSAHVEKEASRRGLALTSGHRFTCYACNPQLLGHRFRCAHCYIAS